jgi:hypothetical protein
MFDVSGKEKVRNRFVVISACVLESSIQMTSVI